MQNCPDDISDGVRGSTSKRRYASKNESHESKLQQCLRWHQIYCDDFIKILASKSENTSVCRESVRDQIFEITGQKRALENRILISCHRQNIAVNSDN